MNSSAKRYFLDREELEAGDCVVRYAAENSVPGWLIFSRPALILQASELGEVQSVLAAVEEHSTQGRYCVGFLSYGAGPALDSHVAALHGAEMPWAWFAVYDGDPEFARELLPEYAWIGPLAMRHEWDFDAYGTRFDRVKRALAEGDAYQINLTFRAEVEAERSMFHLFRRTCGVQPPPYAVYLHGGDWEIASFSPELFVERRGNRLGMCPMKGTQAPGETSSMALDPKSEAENLMIVDMVRNDLGKIAEIGSVTVPSLFHTQSFRTVRQMSSRVECTTSVGLLDLMKAIFPPASVTGAPKIAACQLIEELETSPRAVYCGAIGMVLPGGDLQFSVAIRTAWKTGETVRYGVGSGLVWDSKPHDEFEECLLKAAVLAKPAPQWELIESFHRDALFDHSLLEDHWLRAARSAHEFGIDLNRTRFEDALADLRAPDTGIPEKIRMAIRLDGSISCTASNSAIPNRRLRAMVSRMRSRSADPNMVHKTSSRQLFEQALEAAEGFDEALLVNEREEAVEFCRGNALFLIGDRLVTPAPECGCLLGIGVKRLVDHGRAEYGVVTLAEALSCQAVYFINSVRGQLPVDLAPTT